jgi:hypothetical protein
VRRRPPSFSERRLRSALLRFLRRNVVSLLVFSGFIGTSVIVTTVAVDGYLQGLLHGIALTTGVFAVWQLFLVHGGHMYRLSGIWGEDNTRDVLRGAKRRGLIYGWIDNLEIEGGDVDHLVIASWGLVAIDSKWHTGTLDEESVQHDCSRALAAARRARLILRSEKYGGEPETVVAVWGAQQLQVPAMGMQREEVTIIRGRNLRGWLKSRRDEPTIYSRSTADALLERLDRFRRRVRPS